ncbi:MAG: hypothetical protein VKL39_09935 [Leptolyngbyaceae bacterium]|nr:hypothetical protein [Leptolyngbyaceae bacterium]
MTNLSSGEDFLWEKCNKPTRINDLLMFRAEPEIIAFGFITFGPEHCYGNMVAIAMTMPHPS